MKRLICLVCVLVFAAAAFAACGKQDGGSGNDGNIGYKNDVKVADLEAAVAEAYGENYVASQELDSGLLKDMMGLDPELYEEAIAKIPMISAHVDTLVIVKAKEDNVSSVKEALEKYRQSLVEDTMQYPINVPKIQASEVVAYGNYVCYIMLGFAEDETAGEEELLKQFQEQNQKAKTAIEEMLKQ